MLLKNFCCWWSARALYIILGISLCRFASSLSSSDGSLSRREMLLVPLGAVGSYSYGKLVYKALSVQGINYPEAHEARVKKTIESAFVASMARKTTDRETFRVLEVGVGEDCRLARRGLYRPAIRQLLSSADRQAMRLEVVGLDLVTPKDKVINDAKQRLVESVGLSSLDIDLQFSKQSIMEPTRFENGYFDSIICCFTLCSVDDPSGAVENMRSLLRPNGGTFGFVEHVAVNDDEPYRFLDWQQRRLDIPQQLVAHNCHLHRPTDSTIAQIMGVNAIDDKAQAVLLEGPERFLVDNMWPVSMQSCGVIQLQGLSN